MLFLLGLGLGCGGTFVLLHYLKKRTAALVLTSTETTTTTDQPK